MIDKVGSNFRDYAPVVSRLGLGIIMIVAGGHVIAGRQGVHGLAYDLGGLGWGLGIAWGLLALIAGFLVLIGFATRLAALFLFVIFLVMVFKWYEVDVFTDHKLHLHLACIALSLAVFCGGGGEYSVDNKIQQKKAK